MSESENKVDLDKLTRDLIASEVSFLPKQTVKWGDTVYCFLIPYKTSRVDMDILDDACGIYWQNEYKRDAQGHLECGIGIYFHDLGDWVWRFSNGIPTKVEKEKGEYSDAFKRAGFMWGIGRELYSFPTIRVTLNESEYEKKKNDSYGPTRRFSRELKEEWRWEIKKELGGKHWIIGKFKNKVRFDSNPYESKNSR